MGCEHLRSIKLVGMVTFKKRRGGDKSLAGRRYVWREKTEKEKLMSSLPSVSLGCRFRTGSRSLGKFVHAVALVMGLCGFWGASEAQSAGLRATVKTEFGDMQFELWPDAAPETVANFRFLSELGFYDGTGFHRIIKDFMVQAGDPSSRYPILKGLYGGFGPGYTVKDEFHDKGVRVVRATLSSTAIIKVTSATGLAVGQTVRGDGILPGTVITKVTGRDVTLSAAASKTGAFTLRFGVQHVRGVLSMAHSSAANSGGSQFFIVTKESPHLDGGYAAFGRLVAGDSVLQKISEVAVTAAQGGGEASTPASPVRINSVRVVGSKATTTLTSGLSFGGPIFLFNDRAGLNDWMVGEDKLDDMVDKAAVYNYYEILANRIAGATGETKASYSNTAGTLANQSFEVRSKGFWSLALSAGAGGRPSVSLKTRIPADSVTARLGDHSVTSALTDRGNGLFTASVKPEKVIEETSLGQAEGQDPYLYRRILSKVDFELRQWSETGVEMRIQIEVVKRFYNGRTGSELTDKAITRKYCGVSNSKGASIGPKYTASLSTPQDLGGTYDLVSGKYSMVREVSGYGYATLDVKNGTVSTLVMLPNGRVSTSSLPARMSGTRCFVPFLEASDLAQGFTRLAGQVVFSDRLGSGDVDWVHLPKVANQQVTGTLQKAFLAKSSLTVEPYSPPKVAQAGLFGATDKRISLKLFARLAKPLGVQPVQGTGVQVLAEAVADGASITVNTNSGVFSGTFSETRSGKKVLRTLSGVVLQGSRQGRGFTAGDSEVLPVSLAPL